MVFCGISIELKKTGLAATLLLPCLLLQPLLLQAESSTDVKSDESANKAVASHQAAEGSRTAVQRPATGGGNNASVGFPNWPPRQQAGRETIPPPPPGPYMSSALSDYSVKAPSFGRNINKPVHRYDPSSMPMDVFSPDVPWPKNLRAKNKRSSTRWMPENGYHYVNPQNMASPPNNQQPPIQLRQQNQKRQYRGANNHPNMNMNGSRWMPSMGFAPNGPYNNGPYRNAPVSNGSQYRNQGSRLNQSTPYRSAPDQSGSN